MKRHFIGRYKKARTANLAIAVIEKTAAIACPLCGMNKIKMKVLISIILFLSIYSNCFAQFENIKHFKGDSCDYDLYIYPDGKFSYSQTTTIDFDKQLNIERPIISITNGDTFWLSSNDKVEVETIFAGNWKLTNDTIILLDTTWRKNNYNWKICYVTMLNKYELMNINLPKCKPNSLLYTIDIHDKNNNWFFCGEIKNGIINGKKYFTGSKGNMIFVKNYINESFCENEFFK